VQIVEEFNYRNAEAVINAVDPGLLSRVRGVLTAPTSALDLAVAGGPRTLSSQVQQWFRTAGWRYEVPSVAAPGMRYDLYDGRVPIEIELGHERLVYPDFFEFLADYSAGHIPAGVMIVTHSPRAFGHTWHCSLASTRRKILAIANVYLVPTLLIGVDP
jgi:restriction endonuclease BglII